jgi:hypothetical protein
MHNPLSDDDCSGLLHLLAVVEASVDAAPDGLVARQLRDGFVSFGLLAAGDPIREVRDALARLEARYRFSLGEYTERTIGRAPDGPPGACLSVVPTGE